MAKESPRGIELTAMANARSRASRNSQSNPSRNNGKPVSRRHPVGEVDSPINVGRRNGGDIVNAVPTNGASVACASVTGGVARVGGSATTSSLSAGSSMSSGSKRTLETDTRVEREQEKRLRQEAVQGERQQYGFSYDPEKDKERVERWVRKTMFPKLKFITSRESLKDMTPDRSIAAQLFLELSVPEEVQADWWGQSQGVVYAALGQKRSNCNLHLKSRVIRMYKTTLLL